MRNMLSKPRWQVRRALRVGPCARGPFKAATSTWPLARREPGIGRVRPAHLPAAPATLAGLLSLRRAGAHCERHAAAGRQRQGARAGPRREGRVQPQPRMPSRQPHRPLAPVAGESCALCLHDLVTVQRSLLSSALCGPGPSACHGSALPRPQVLGESYTPEDEEDSAVAVVGQVWVYQVRPRRPGGGAGGRRTR